MTAADPKPHPLYLTDHAGYAVQHRLGVRTGATARPVSWSAQSAYAGGRGGRMMRRLTGKLVAVTWRAYFTDAGVGHPDESKFLVVETSGPVTVFTLEERLGYGHGNRTRHIDSFTCPADVNGLFLTHLGIDDPAAYPVTEYLMERDCPADILAFFW